METATATLAGWEHPLAEATGIPLNVLAAIGSLVIGLLLALLLRRLTLSALRRFGHAIPEVGRPAGLREADLARTRTALGRLVFWLTITLAVMAATEQLGLPVLTAWISGVASYLPRVVVAVLVLVLGLAMARVAGRTAARLARRVGIADGARLGRVAEIAVYSITALVAIEALGIDITFIEVALLVVLAGALLGGALAFGGGARALVADILACHYIQRVYEVGHTLRIPGDEGTAVEGSLVRIVPPLVILETRDGEVSVPGSQLTSGRVTRTLPPS